MSDHPDCVFPEPCDCRGCYEEMKTTSSAGPATSGSAPCITNKCPHGKRINACSACYKEELKKKGVTR